MQRIVHLSSHIRYASLAFLFVACTVETDTLITLPDTGQDTAPADLSGMDAPTDTPAAADTLADSTSDDTSTTDAAPEDTAPQDSPLLDSSETTMPDAVDDALIDSSVEDSPQADDLNLEDNGAEEEVMDDVPMDVETPITGDGLSCATAYQVTEAPIVITGDTSTANPTNEFSAGQCSGEAGGWGLASPDLVYAFTPETTAHYTITLEAEFDSVLYIATECSNVGANCLAANDLIGVGATEAITLELEQDTPVFIVVDGYSNTNALGGAFTLSISEPCTPQCIEGSCDDGCGGICPCAEGLSCNPINGLCETGTGGDTCDQASVIVDIPFAALGNTSGAYEDTYSVASFACSGLDLGAGYGSKDAVFRFTPKATTKYALTAKPDPGYDISIYVVGDCDALSATCVGGADNVGPSGQENLTVTLEANVPYYIVIDGAGPSIDGGFAIGLDFECKPTCEQGMCGADGCGGVCPCGEGQSCLDEVCCTPLCDGLTCSDDNCGGTCACAPGTLCEPETTACINAAEGDQCANPFTIDAKDLPAMVLGTTVGAENDYFYGINACKGEPSGWGAGSGDVTYSFTPTLDAVYEISLIPFADYDATLYIVQDCLDINDSCLAGSETFTGAPGEKAESISLYLESGMTYFIVVDGFANESNVTGNFQLDISTPCFPTCTPGLCGGPDGCGSTCGCSEGKLCHPQTNACVASMGGDACAEATSIPPLSAAAGDTSLANDLYGVEPGACPGLDGDGGYGSADQTYVMTPNVTGVYPITLESDFDGILYAVKNCNNVTNTCLAGVDDVSEGETETLFLTASANQEYFIIVDGFGLGSEGVYLLNIGAPCILECTPGTCGSDGCGGQCQCSIGQECIDGLCE